MARFRLNIKTYFLYVVWEMKIKFGQNFFASPKICTPVHLYYTHRDNVLHTVVGLGLGWGGEARLKRGAL